MSLSTEDGPLREAAILTRAVENVFRKLIRLLMGRMSLVKLQEIIRIIFVEEAEGKIKKERPGRNVPLTQLALLTGLDTRTLNKLLEDLSKHDPIHDSEEFLKGLMPEHILIEYWMTNKNYLNEQDSTPLELSLTGTYPSFDSLVKEALPSRGITTKSIIDRFLITNAVLVNNASKKIMLVKEKYSNFIFTGDLDGIRTGMVAIANLAETVIHNSQIVNGSTDPYFQRTIWSTSIDRNNIIKLRKLIRDFLENTEKEAAELMYIIEEDSPAIPVTAGISMFYFEDQSSV
jgi:hypothetical protein